ncbi:serine/threonine protein kinase, partial [Escherichia coli]|nr:serine/threonine protein kinase [Escherichia coli]
RLAGLGAQLTGQGGNRLTVAAVVVVLGLVAALGGWWFGVGRYTTAPQLVSMTKAEAEAEASQSGFAVTYADPRYDDQIPRDGVVG